MQTDSCLPSGESSAELALVIKAEMLGNFPDGQAGQGKQFACVLKSKSFVQSVEIETEAWRPVV
jgi:hypothetical protein